MGFPNSRDIDMNENEIPTGSHLVLSKFCNDEFVKKIGIYFHANAI